MLLSPIAGRNSEDFWQLAVSFCLIFGVFIPAIAVVPYRWAGRFSGIWSPSGLSDLWASRLSPWERVWAVVLPPVLLWAYTLGAILAVLIAGCSLFQGIDGLDLISVWKGVPVAWSWVGLALAGCHAFLALGVLRRRIQRGMVALVLSAGMLVAGAAGLIALTKGLTAFVNDPFLRDLIFTTGSGLFLLFAGRWALASAPRSLERVVQGE